MQHSHNGKLGGKKIILWDSDFLFQLDKKGVIAKSEGLTAASCSRGIEECPIDCRADIISKEHPCYVGIFHENREGKLTFDIGFQIKDLEGFGIKANKV